ncbi:MAG TPA: APC family permease [Candidatus Saccharimonadales bacterium]|nr:APC family permease [Candidatus Saccharimonadales bacterium]
MGTGTKNGRIARGGHGQKLGQFLATAICGNDILSSALYVSGVAIMFTGVYAPVILLFICLVLFLYKAVYTEVVEALPLNGGAYNCLLNGTSKTFAATAGTMTILSYMATAVLSGNVGVEYLSRILTFPIMPMTIGLLAVLGLLVVGGIKDSARVALGIFSFHVLTLIAFLILGAVYAFHGGASYLASNMHHTSGIVSSKGLIITLVLGFSASLLGVSGFESSANFVEEQKKGTFRKTLRNMLIGVTIFNPLIALVVLNTMSLHAVGAADNFLLADAARVIGGKPFEYLVSIDAFVVLWGAVLTAFVGVSGLMHRMAGDACLPNILTRENKRGSYPYIVLVFFLLCSSILLVTKGNLLSLAGVYTIAFLGVMSSFALGNLILKLNRSELKRSFKAPAIFAILAFSATAIGVIGNIYLDPRNFVYFCMYFIPSFIVVLCVIYEDAVLGFLLRTTRQIPLLNRYIEHTFNDLIQGKFVVLLHNTNRLSRILNYIYRNETGRKVTLVVCKDQDTDKTDHPYKEIAETLPYLQKAGIYPKLQLSLVYNDKPFGPEVIDDISKQFKVRKNRILIGSIHNHHPYNYDELGGVRIIF